MKLIIQIPCYNESENIRQTFDQIPRKIKGIDEIEVLVIDDGSTDNTSDVAEGLGVHYLIRFPENKGLAASHIAGLDACLRLGADIVVNTDGDNQYRGKDIETLVKPIVEQRADIVIGDRRTDHIEHFSIIKKLLQKWGSSVVRRASGTDVVDSTSGFRAFSRDSLFKIFVHNRFTYTLETIIQAGRLGLTIKNVPVETNRPTRKSRLSKSTFDYIRRNGLVILRSYSMYWPVQVFGAISIIFFLLGITLGMRFLYYYLQAPTSARISSRCRWPSGRLSYLFLSVWWRCWPILSLPIDACWKSH